MPRRLVNSYLRFGGACGIWF